ncbi:hypothetical protein BABINDRAFT_34204 [Babjeviella inositovora NRRL Y-12698]|uniref:Intimal thickness related receptor IRP domain-containing protein n=1 Tax=Babjeviella inositovora NRRL Y-12698 TaxID=984486 RepID=A0A1E3QU23_9ASCO|nr:uncharacterized protein BABINDRAFT_34204 [Babjeviella inositovora NRRL Y-12698]ODQ81198.1 hypothetical protein BABINDRAFT_34204 [Babjeviella inositovora NRRL Y-12698]
MKFALLISLASLAVVVHANQGSFNEETTRVCAGMYSREDWQGNIDPYISVYLDQYKAADSLNVSVSMVVLQYRDYHLLGIPNKNNPNKKTYICDSAAIAAGLCEEKSRNRVLINQELANSTIHSQIMTTYVTSLGQTTLKYQIKHTGYYCVFTYSHEAESYSGTVDFRNAFGQLSASEIPKLPLYGMLAIFYGVGLALYAWAFYRHRAAILPLQKYLVAFFGFLTAETILIWSYYDLQNQQGLKKGVLVYMFFIAILNSVKISFSLFLLLLISLGYGVVYPKLSKKVMLRCKILAGLTFITTAVYVAPDYIVNPDSKSLAAFFVVVPAAVTFAVFYVTILTSMRTTTTFLREQRQVIKLHMYQTLFNVIFASMIVIFLGMFASTFVYFGYSSVDTIESHWKSRFFIFSFWPSIAYFFVFTSVAFIWRPTADSYMLAVSSQLPTSADQANEFDLDDLSLMSDGEEDQRNTRRNDSFDLDLEEDHAQYAASTTAVAEAPSKGETKVKRSLDDDATMFQLEDEGLFSDDEDRTKKSN